MSEQIKQAGNLLQSLCHSASAGAGWWGAFEGASVFPQDVLHVRSPVSKLGKLLVCQKLALIHSEVSEALEGARKDKQDEHLPHRKSVEVELADAVIRIMDLAGALGLDIGAAIAEKMAYNAQRADHKPEARAAAGGKAF